MWRWLPEDSPLRETGARLDPIIHPPTEAVPEGRVEQLEASLGHPEQKDSNYMRTSAVPGDADYMAGRVRRSKRHAVKRTGVLASHPFMKIVYWDDVIMRQPDPMHTIGNEMKAVAEMVMGGTGKAPAYSAAQLPLHAKYKSLHNQRWTDILTPFLPGKLLVFAFQCNLDCDERLIIWHHSMVWSCHGHAILLIMLMSSHQ